MNWKAMFWLLVTTLYAGAFPAMAIMTNKGEDLPLVPCPNQLTPYEGRANGRILYAPAEVDDPDYRAAIAAITGGVVDYYDARVGTPSLQLLQTYDCVMTWPNYPYHDAIGFGDNLAQFVDNWYGTVILGPFSTYCSGYPLAGAVMNPFYCPVVSPTCSNHFESSSYAHDGETGIYNDVTAFDCVYRDVLVTQGDGVVDGHYQDGEIAHAYRPDFKVICSNGGGAFPLYGGGDWPRLIANASCVVLPGQSGACCLPSGGCTYAGAVQCGDFMHGSWWPCRSCDELDCPDAGACCLPDGTCEMWTESYCENQGGQPQGPGSVCFPELCVPVPSMPTSWGQVKRLYR